MLRNLYAFCLLTAAVLISISFRKPARAKDHWVKLYNGKNLDGWDTYLGPGYDTITHKRTPAPGLNNDILHVFTIADDNGEKLIHISGEQGGAITSKGEYENFHLQLMFKWGVRTWGQKRGKKKDSGLLYFCVGPDAADGANWMRSQEFQIEEGNTGEYWGVAGAFDEIPADKINDSVYVYNPTAQLYTFREHTPVGRHCFKRGDGENPTGQWNTLDLYCHGDTSVHVVNGKVMMVLYHSQQWDNGVATPLAKGKLQIQSEGAEVYYKAIKVEGIDKIPVGMLK